MRDYAAKRGWSLVAQIKEVGSGASQRELRESLLATARRREIDVVMVWRLDRWAGPSQTWFPRYRNFSISEWVSYR